jgi:Tfp pilus assembly protein PilN
MIRINLLPAKVRTTKGVQRVTTYVILGGSALALVLVLLLLNLLALTQRAEVKTARALAATAQLAETVHTVHGWTAREQYADRVRTLIRQLLPQQALWINVLDELAGLTREDLWLTQLQAAPLAAKNPLRLSVEGEAYSKISVADFLSALENSSRFREVQLDALTDTPAGDRIQVKFKVRFVYQAEETGGGTNP